MIDDDEPDDRDAADGEDPAPQPAPLDTDPDPPEEGGPRDESFRRAYAAVLRPLDECSIPSQTGFTPTPGNLCLT
jgi:hypothetical protein